MMHFDSAVFFLGIHPIEIKTLPISSVSSAMFTAAAFVVAEDQRQSKCQ